MWDNGLSDIVFLVTGIAGIILAFLFKNIAVVLGIIVLLILIIAHSYYNERKLHYVIKNFSDMFTIEQDVPIDLQYTRKLYLEFEND